MIARYELYDSRTNRTFLDYNYYFQFHNNNVCVLFHLAKWSEQILVQKSKFIHFSNIPVM